MLIFDLYKQPFNLRLPDGQSKYRSLPGALCSICTIIIFIVFATLKLTTISNLDEYRVIESELELTFTDKDRFGTDDDFMVAATLSGYAG